MTSGSRLQVVWPAPDLQVDFCYAIVISALKSSTKPKFAGRKVNVELPALRPAYLLTRGE
jgi:hypothetical protein